VKAFPIDGQAAEIAFPRAMYPAERPGKSVETRVSLTDGGEGIAARR